MPNLSNWVGVGHVGRTPEMKELDGGKTVTTFPMAVNTGYGDKKKTSWFSINCWGASAKFVGGYVNKGDSVAVIGELEIEEYKGKDDSVKVKVKVTANKVELLSVKKSEPEGDDPF